MRIYVANLGAYNNGELKGEWFDLSVVMEEVFQSVFDEHELDESGQPYGDYAIHDYELPFEINEYTSIEALNDIAEDFDSPELYVFTSGDYDIQDVINFANDFGYEEYSRI